jgi:SAM-dependent methyltransferase
VSLPLRSLESIELDAMPNCPGCDAPGEPLYSGLRDHTFGAPGEWSCSRCVACGAIWLNPRPAERDVSKVYREYYTHDLYVPGDGFRSHLGRSRLLSTMVASYLAASAYLRRNALATTMGYGGQATGMGGRVLASVLSAPLGLNAAAWISVLGLRAKERGSLLDVGCGNGTYLATMKELGWHTVGIETDEHAAEIARNRFGLDVRIGSLADAMFPADSFDAISLSHVIEHVYDPVALLTECCRILRPGGKLIVLTPNTRSLGHRIFRAAWRGLEPPRHIQLFNRSTLSVAVQRAGLRVMELRTASRMMQGIWDASRRIQRANRDLPMKNSRRDYVTSYVMEAVERLMGVVWEDAGEELVLVAIK